MEEDSSGLGLCRLLPFPPPPPPTPAKDPSWAEAEMVAAAEA